MTAVPPVIRALAEKHSVDLAAVQGTGPAGRIMREDVIAAKRGAAPVAAAAPAPARPAAGPLPAALSHAQSAVARKVSQSHREKPVYRVHSKVEVGRVIAAREQAKARGTALSWDAVLVKACAMAVTEMPVFRRWLKGEEVAEHPEPDIAVAVGVGEDLVIPAVRGAAEKKVGAVSAEIAELARKAEARTLGPKEIEGSCLLVSNLGMFPVESFDAIVYPEHAAALAAGALTHTPVSDGVRTWIAALVHLTLTVDHRLINGRTAAQFIARVKQILETGEFA
jgi:pyruvate dehydrogenase E2 component (dihydrolipoamide acetyltransferase)